MRSSIVIPLVFTAGCAAAEHAPAEAPKTASGAAPGAPMPPAPPSEAPKDQAVVRDLVVSTAHYTMAVYQVDRGIAAVERIAKEQAGHLAVKKSATSCIATSRRST